MCSSEDEIEEMAEAIARTLQDYGMDGAVVELWSQMPASKHKYII